MSDAEESDSECELNPCAGDGFFSDLGDGFVPATWDFTKAMESATVASKSSTKSLVENMIRDSALEEMIRGDGEQSDDDEDRMETATGGKDVGDVEDVVKRKKKDEFFEQPPPQVVTSTFMEMNLSRPLLKAISRLGYVHPTPIQTATIPIALAGKDICACAATGTGKTAAFILPILERLLFRPQESMTRVLVLLPTRELAVQVHAVATSLAEHTSVTACLAAGGLDMRQQEAALRKIPDIVIATPGRLVDHLHNTPSFSLTGVEILVLDEADRMLQEHFQEQLHEILRVCYRGRQTMLFSATMTDEVEELISLSLNQPVRLFINNNTQVAAKLQQEFVRIRSHREDSRAAIVAAMCCRSFSGHVIIFVNTKVLAHRLRIQLGLLGLNVEELHGDLTQLQRLEALESFKKAEVDYLIATDLASRGLDISGVKTVINFSMPSSIKQYVHRVGRTARAGKSGRSVSLVGEKERKMLKQIIKDSGRSVKVRVVAPEVIEKFGKKLTDIEPKVKTILKQEAEEKEVRKAEMEVGKAQNMIDHREEIFSRPKRKWLATKDDHKMPPKKKAKEDQSMPPKKKAKEDQPMPPKKKVKDGRQSVPRNKRSRK
eukprot:scpid38468/ scgid1211/ Probable ATP-dependent RNA helicase DDX27; DEAD box protein 27